MSQMRAWNPIVGMTLLGLLPLVGCGLLAAGLEAYTDCGTYVTQYDETLETEGKFSDTIAFDEPYPMSIIVSEDSLNRIFAEVSEGDLEELSWDYDVYGIPFTLIIGPDIPLIQVGGEQDCGDCILLDMSFGIWIELYGIQYGGSGSVRYQFPLSIRDNGVESSTVYARLGESEILDLDLSITGIPDYYLELILPYVELTANIIIQEYYGDTDLFALEAWKLGNGDIKLLGRGPIISPENKTVVIGIHTNLIRPLDGSIAVDPILPAGADIGLQFHPELVQQIVERMLFEGFIARDYDSSGDDDSSAKMSEAASDSLSVTLNKMNATSDGLLDTSFRLWRTSGDYCGYADLEGGFGLSISDKDIKLSMQNLTVGTTAGAGDLLVVADDWLDSQFVKDMAQYSELSINYRNLTLPYGKQAEMSSESFRLTVDAYGLSIYLNLDAIIDQLE